MIVMKLLLFCVFTVVPNVSTESSANTASKTVPDNETPSRDRVFEGRFQMYSSTRMSTNFIECLHYNVISKTCFIPISLLILIKTNKAYSFNIG